MMEPDISFKDLSDKVRQSIRNKYHTHPDAEDLAQEGVIRAWKLWMDNTADEPYGPGYILYWSMIWVSRYVGDKSSPFTGSASQHGGGTAQETHTTERGDAIRDKIKSAQREFYDIHRKMPSHVEIGKMTGLEARRVSKYVNRPNFNLPPEVDRVRHVTLDKNEEVGEWASADLVKATSQESFEDTVVASMSIRAALPELKPREREVIFLHYWKDLPQATVAKTMEVSPPYVHRIHKNALSTLREIFNVEVSTT